MRKRTNDVTIDRPDYYTIADIMALMKVGRSTVYKLIEQGDLTKIKIGSLVRITADSYDALRRRAESDFKQLER